VGQIRLAHAYREALGRRDVRVSQVLLTIDDSENRRRYLNARNTLSTLMRLGTVSVINENDTVATAEIRYGDNDRLAARVAQMMSADCLVLLSDVGGLYTGDPRRDATATLIPEVTEIDEKIAAMAGGAGTGDGSGGMVTKIAAAQIAHAAGCHTVIANGRVDHPLRAIEDCAPCTWFVPSATPRAARKQWIAGSLEPIGTVTVDAGAARALDAGKSLLPAGVVKVEGTFQRGDSVIVRDPDGAALGRGLCAYSIEDARRIMGHKSCDIEALLGYRGRDEMIHRDDLVLSGLRPVAGPMAEMTDGDA
jgi:glutamate 5-kinase